MDALLGLQTRSHEDLDIAVQHKDVPALRGLLEARGYREFPSADTKDFNFVLSDSRGRKIDVHSYTFDPQGSHVYGIAYPIDSLTGTGMINGHPVKCISAEWAVKFHTQYEPDETDYQDVQALCARFEISQPDPTESSCDKALWVNIAGRACCIKMSHWGCIGGIGLRRPFEADG